MNGTYQGDSMRNTVTFFGYVGKCPAFFCVTKSTSCS